MIGDIEVLPQPSPPEDIAVELEEWIGRGAVPLSIARYALNEIKRIRGIAVVALEEIRNIQREIDSRLNDHRG